jgi:hypothetical protein
MTLKITLRRALSKHRTFIHISPIESWNRILMKGFLPGDQLNWSFDEKECQYSVFKRDRCSG